MDGRFMHIPVPASQTLTRRHLATKVLIGVLFAVVLALSLQYAFKATANRSAIMRWREQLQHLGEENIYLRYAYPNPPIMAMLLEPIAHLPPLAGSLLWFYLKIGLAMISVLWAFRLVETRERPFPLWAKILTIGLCLRPILGDLSHGNVNIFILFLVVAALLAFRHQRDFLTGLLLALAIACKVTPALFIPYFLWKRAWKVLAGCAAGLALFLLILPGLYLGSEQNWTLLRSWVDQMVTPYMVKGTVTTEHQNQSLPGVLYRLTTRSPSFLDDNGAPERYDNFASLDPRTANWIIKATMALFAMLIVIRCRTPLSLRQGWRLPAEFGLVVLGMLLFSERTWKHHCVTLVIPFAVISYYLAAVQASLAMRCYLIGSLFAVFVMMASTSTTLLESADAKMAQVYGAYVWAYIVLAAALFVILRKRGGLLSESGPQPVVPAEAATGLA
jgi:hypothetical protein